jgi:hypothetical protein
MKNALLAYGFIALSIFGLFNSRNFNADSIDLGNCSKCRKPLSPWDIDIAIPLKDNSGRVICKTCRSYFMAADWGGGYYGYGKGLYYNIPLETPRKIIVMPLNWPINNELVKIKEQSKKKEDMEKENFKKSYNPYVPESMNEKSLRDIYWGDYFENK